MLTIALAAIGGLAELTGLYFVGREIRGDRQLAEQYLTRMESQGMPSFGGPAGPIKPEAMLIRDWERSRGTPEEQIRRSNPDFDRTIEQVRAAAARAAY